MTLYLKVVEVAIEHDEKFLIIKRPEGKHVLKPWIYLGFGESAFLHPSFFRERKQEQQ